MGNGEWGMGNGEWGMGSGGMVNISISVFPYLPIPPSPYPPISPSLYPPAKQAAKSASGVEIGCKL